MTSSSIDRRHLLIGAGASLAAIGAFGASQLVRGAPGGTGKRTLVAVIGEDPPTMNPGVSTVPSCLEASSPAYSGLLNMGADGTLSPCLAEKWDVSPDFKTFAFDLRQGVTWHDGRPFTSADVKFTIEEVLSKLHPMGRTIYKFLDRVETPTDHRAVIQLKKSYPRLLRAAFSFWPMLPRHLAPDGDILQSRLSSQPVGTGAYKLSQYSPGEFVLYTKNESYFEKGVPYFDEIMLRIVPSPAAQLLAFQSGDVDILHSSAVPTPDLPLLTSFPGARLHLSQQMGGAYLATLNLRTPVLKDLRVRQAIAHTIDRKFIRESVLPMISQPMVGPIWPTSSLYDHGLSDYELSPLRASQLLDDAGLYRDRNGDRIELRLLWAGGDVRIGKIADIMAQNLAEAGIRLRLQPLERSTLIQKSYVEGAFDLLVESFALGPDPDFGTERLYNSNNIKPLPFSNASHYRNPEVDRLFDLQRQESDPSRRLALYRAIQQKIWADLPVLPLASTGVSCLSNDRFVSNVFDANWTAQTDGMVRARAGLVPPARRP